MAESQVIICHLITFATSCSTALGVKPFSTARGEDSTRPPEVDCSQAEGGRRHRVASVWSPVTTPAALRLRRGWRINLPPGDGADLPDRPPASGRCPSGRHPGLLATANETTPGAGRLPLRFYLRDRKTCRYGGAIRVPDPRRREDSLPEVCASSYTLPRLSGARLSSDPTD